MAIKKNIPHWLLNQLNEGDKKQAMIWLLQGLNTGTVANRFGVENPYIGLKKPGIRITKSEKIRRLQKLAKQLGRMPKSRDVNLCSFTPSNSGYTKVFGSWNKALKAAGFESKSIRTKTKSLEEKVKKYKNFSVKKICKEYLVDKMSLNQLGKKYGSSKTAIRNFLIRHNIKMRPIGLAKLKLPEKQICEGYSIDKLNRLQLAKKYKCSKSGIYNILRRNKIETSRKIKSGGKKNA